MKHNMWNKIVRYFACALAVFSAVGCEKDANIKQYVYPVPEVEKISPDAGYVTSQVIIYGKNFGDRTEAVKVLFGGIEAENVLSCKDNCIVVEVPEKALTGDVELTVWTNTVVAGKYEVWASPVVSEYTTASGTVVVNPGDEVVIKGEKFGKSEEDVYVTFGGVKGEVTSWSDTEVKAVAPADFPTGALVLNVNGLDINIGGILNPTKKGDVTIAYLKNYEQPFKIDPNMTDAQKGVSASVCLPADWIVNEAGRSALNNGATEKVAGLNNDNLILQAGWDWGDFTNGKLYQTTTLPKGSYNLTVNFKEYGVKAGSSLYFAVAAGNEVPDVDDVTSNSIAYHDFGTGENKTPSECVIEFEITEDTQDVALGFVASFSANSWFRATGLKLELK